jgi:hypothetical protein
MEPWELLYATKFIPNAYDVRYIYFQRLHSEIFVVVKRTQRHMADAYLCKKCSLHWQMCIIKNTHTGRLMMLQSIDGAKLEAARSIKQVNIQRRTPVKQNLRSKHNRK